MPSSTAAPITPAPIPPHNERVHNVTGQRSLDGSWSRKACYSAFMPHPTRNPSIPMLKQTHAHVEYVGVRLFVQTDHNRCERTAMHL